MKCKIIILLLVFFFYLPILYAQDTSITNFKLITGQYDSGRLYIAFDAVTNKVSGYIEQKDGNAFCSLYFKGKCSNTDTTPVSFYLFYIDSTISDSGFLSFKNKEIKITSSGKGSVGPCSRIMSIQQDVGGETFTLTKPYTIRQIALIQTVRQFLYKTPYKKTKRKIYLVKGDPVELVKENKNWFFIQYIEKRKYLGWIPENAIFK